MTLALSGTLVLNIIFFNLVDIFILSTQLTAIIVNNVKSIITYILLNIETRRVSLLFII